MGRPVIRIGDQTSHGGVVKTGSSEFIVDGKGVARLGDTCSCPLHPSETVIDSGSETYITDGKPTARDGDKTACGATLIASQTSYFIE
ncbi:Zn-binding Pro-Ala-Ala-Arg (PAAR) domain-containing protein, incolved in TypeVI secretion [Duganella sp. CF458]|uniref:PAAR domain-containing protein n=1 Tax=Duganella sp. CF458 TaxID=1884368 RepID=UPI0008DFDA61|nr:PAAR domain-containing protein [Duganella sp. CF458]SFG74725.1 Zn-binding Pro-Ala-Ala-Arg (PAAR) domain-containing protein, incolved in TypeVI secretion [Duganella sp. CF458]